MLFQSLHLLISFLSDHSLCCSHSLHAVSTERSCLCPPGPQRLVLLLPSTAQTRRRDQSQIRRHVQESSREAACCKATAAPFICVCQLPTTSPNQHHSQRVPSTVANASVGGSTATLVLHIINITAAASSRRVLWQCCASSTPNAEDGIQAKGQ